MTIYPAAIYIVLNNNIFKIIIFTNPNKKYLEFNKNIRLETIYKYIDITYIITNIIKIFTIMATTSSIFSDLFSTVQKETIFGNRYQNINLIIQLFEKNIELLVFGAEFTFTPEIEAMFIIESSIYSPFSKIDSSINIVF